MIEHPHLLLCYDGSEQATEAIRFAAALFPRGTQASVLYVWESAAVPLSGGYGPLVMPPIPDDQEAARAASVAEAGAEEARALGLDAEARSEEAQASAWQTIVDVADGEVDMIIMGTRGLSGLRSLLLGSCAHHVVQHARCPVLVVPDAELGSARRRVAREHARVGT